MGFSSNVNIGPESGEHYVLTHSRDKQITYKQQKSMWSLRTYVQHWPNATCTWVWIFLLLCLHQRNEWVLLFLCVFHSAEMKRAAVVFKLDSFIRSSLLFAVRHSSLAMIAPLLVCARPNPPLRVRRTGTNTRTQPKIQINRENKIIERRRRMFCAEWSVTFFRKYTNDVWIGGTWDKMKRKKDK